MMGWLGIEFKIVPTLFDEKTIRDTNAEVLTKKLSQAKVKSILNNFPDSIIIGSDAVVVFEGQILEKAVDESDQRRLILMQKEKKAEVVTSVCIINSTINQEIVKTVAVPYKMSNVTGAQIEDYIKSGKGLDKAGGYGLQDLNGKFLESINGCFPSALGFPICEVSEILQSMGVQITVDIKKLVKEKTGNDC